MRQTWFILVALAGCSSDSTAPTNSVPERCRDTVEVLCTRNATCAAVAGEITQAQEGAFIDNCKAGAFTTLDCSRQTKILGNPDACDADMMATPCSLYVLQQGLPLPASCKALYAP